MTRRGGAVHVATTRRHYKDKVYETHLLRRSYREGGRVKTETLGNLSHLPAATIELIRRSLKGEVFVPAGHAPLGPDGLKIARSLPHGHVAAAAAMAAKLGLVELIGPPCRERDLVVGLVLARVCKPSSKLAATRWWADTTVGVDLGLLDASTDQVYAAMDWLLSRQQPIQATLAARHLAGGGRAGPARWPSRATPGTASGASRRSSTASSPTRRAGRSRSRCWPATPATPRRLSPRSPRCASGSACARSPSLVTGA